MWRTILPLALCLGGCSLTPALELPSLPLSSAWGQAAAPVAAEAAPLAIPPWWRAFRQPELDALVDTALGHNHQLAATVARIEQARAQLGAAEAPLWPTLEGSLASSHAKRAAANTTTRSVGPATQNTRQGSLSVAYEVDFWGRRRAALAAAEATWRASRFDHEAVTWSLTAEVATTWLQLAALQERLAVAEGNLATARQTLQLAQQRVAFGKSTPLEAAQQQVTVSQLEAQLPALALQRQQAEHALNRLLGAAPAGGPASLPGLAAIALPQPRPGLPAEVLHNRPDLRRAEANLEAAHANLEEARAKLFPSLTLTGERGYASQHLADLLNPAHAFWSLGTSLGATLFDHGQRQEEVKRNAARLQELAATYQGTVLTALGEVEDGLAATRHLQEQETAQLAARQAAREAFRLASIRYREGAVDILAVLESQRALLEAEDRAVQVRLARLHAAVTLCKALGGSP